MQTVKTPFRLGGCTGWSVFDRHTCHSVGLVIRGLKYIFPFVKIISNWNHTFLDDFDLGAKNSPYHTRSFMNIWKLRIELLASFINTGSCARVWNYHEHRILFIIWPFSIGIYRPQSGHYLNRKLIVVTDSWCYMFAPKCYVTCGHTIFITWRYPLNNSDIIWAMLCENVSYAICEQQSSRSADIPAQSDLRLCWSLLRKWDILYTCFVQRFRI